MKRVIDLDKENVEGFTNQQMFESLTDDFTTINGYRINLINNFLGVTTNTQQELDELFDNY